MFHPMEWRERKTHGAVFGAGPKRMNLEPLLPKAPDFREEVVPFTHSGLASGSIRLFRKGAEDPSNRLPVGARGDELVLLFVDEGTKSEASQSEDGFELTLNGTKHVFELSHEG